MLLIIHVMVAIISIIWSAFTYISPSKLKLRGSYGLVTLTLASGTYLVISSGSPILQSCLTGLAYLAVIFGAIISTRQKLFATAQASKSNNNIK